MARLKSDMFGRLRGPLIKNMVWPDRVGLGAALLVALLTATMIGFLALHDGGASFTGRHLLDLIIGGLKLELVFALPLWIAVRIIDFITGGPQRRDAERK